MKKLLLTLIFCFVYFTVWAQCDTTTVPVEAAIVNVFPTSDQIVHAIDNGTDTFLLSSVYSILESDNLSPTKTIRGTFSAKKMAIAGTKAIIIGQFRPAAGGTNTAHLITVDITNVNAPVKKGELVSNYPPTQYYDVAINSTGTIGLIAAGSAGLVVVNLSTFTAPVVAGEYDSPGICQGVGISADNTKAYIADGTSGMKVVNISTPSAPALLGGYAPTGVWIDIAVAGNYVCIVNQSSTNTVVVDVSNPAQPVQRGTCTIVGFGIRVAIDKINPSLVGIISYNSSTTMDMLSVFNISNPYAPVKKAEITIGAKAMAKEVELRNGLAYVAGNTEGLKVYTIP